MPRRWHNDYFLYLCKHEEKPSTSYISVGHLPVFVHFIGRKACRQCRLAIEMTPAEYMRLASSK